VAGDAEVVSAGADVVSGDAEFLTINMSTALE
jgi:hypothetical protein